HRAMSASSIGSKLLFISYVPAAIAGVILTGSRGAALALLASAVPFALSSARRIRVGWVLSFVAVSVAVAFTVPANILSRFATIPEELLQGSLANRRTVWSIGWSLAANHPIFGLGAGAGDATLSSAFGATRIAHNVPLALALDGGALGVSLFYIALTCGLVRAWTL